MDTKKSLALVLAAVLVLLCAGGGAAAAHFAKDAKENKALFLNELRALETAAAAEPFADDIFTAALEKQACTGDWAKAEKAAKACLRDVHSCFEEMQTVRVYYDFFWLITGDNIMEDGPYFEASLAQIDTAAARAATAPAEQRPTGAVVNSTPQLPAYILKPESYDDVETVVRRVRTKQPVALVFVNVRTEVAKRVLDFSYGFACGSGAGVKEVGDRVFMVLPQGCEVKESDLAKLRSEGYLRR